MLSHKLHVYLEQVLFLFRFPIKIITPCNVLSETESKSEEIIGCCYRSGPGRSTKQLRFPIKIITPCNFLSETESKSEE